MELITCPTEIWKCKPFYRASGSSESGPRIGGRPPKGVLPSANCEDAKYLLTLPLVDGGRKEVTVFYSWDKFKKMTAVPNNSVEIDFGAFIDLVIHGPSVRSDASPFTSDLSEHPVIFTDLKDDSFINDDGNLTPLPDHKTGGRPYQSRNLDDLFVTVADLQKEGFLQIVQMEFMSSNDVEWEGNWPFADGLFHLFGRVPFAARDWFWIWQY